MKILTDYLYNFSFYMKWIKENFRVFYAIFINQDRKYLSMTSLQELWYFITNPTGFKGKTLIFYIDITCKILLIDIQCVSFWLSYITF